MSLAIRQYTLNLTLGEKRIDLPEYKRFKDMRAEVQIRTIIQDAWSVLDHKLQYKRYAPPNVSRAINSLAALFERADTDFIGIRDKVATAELVARETKLQQVKTKELSTETKLVGPAVSTNSQNLAEPPDSVDAISLNELLKREFHDYFGGLSATSKLLDELYSKNIQVNFVDFTDSIKRFKRKIEEYDGEKFILLNPLTKLRHCLYLYDKSKFEKILFEFQRDSIESWFNTKTPPPQASS